MKTRPANNDEYLIRSIQAGGDDGESSMIQLYTKYYRYIRYRITRHILKSRKYASGATDLVHDSFIILIRRLRTKEEFIGSLRGYWLGIAYHLLVNVNKKQARLTLVKDFSDFSLYEKDTPEDILIRKDISDLVDKYLNRCNGRCREILLMWLNDYSMQEIADKVNLSSAAMARKLKHECFQKLKKMLEDGNETGS